MAEEFAGDLAGSVFWGADLSGAHFRDVNLTHASISHAWLIDVDIDALVERLVINGVDVTDYVNERDPWFPLRTMLLADTVDGMVATWAALEHEWSITMSLAATLPESAMLESVNGQWSLVQTLRHLVFATDKWFTAPIVGQPFDAMGIPNSGSASFAWPGIDRDANPTMSAVEEVRRARMDSFGAFLAAVAESDLQREVDVAENGPHTILDCVHTVFEEEFWHNRYARRDLLLLAPADELSAGHPDR